MSRRPDEVISHLKPKLLGRMTQRAVVDALHAAGPLSRMDIARRTGISATTVSSAVALLADAGLVEDDARAVAGPGRPRQLLRLATASEVVGVSVEPGGCAVAVAGLDGHPRPGRGGRFPTPAAYPDLLDALERHVRDTTAAGGSRALGVGLSLPGMLDPAGRRTVFSPNLHQIDDHRPADDLQARLGLPVAAVHETDALCLAERRELGADDLAVIDFSGGLGAGVLRAGRPMGVPLELGHLTVAADGPGCGCGNRGCLETLATDAAFARRLAARVGRPLGVDAALALARADFAGYEADVDAVLDALAVAVAALVNLFALPVVVLHGRLLDLRPDLLDRLAAKAAARTLPPLRGGHVLLRGTTTKADGAAAAVLERLFAALGPVLPSGEPAG